VESLVQAILTLMKQFQMPLTIKDCGVSLEAFEERLETLANLAFEDQCTPANPKMPLVTELMQIYRDAYHGTGIV
jgi:acetaldehyde dehydrogenase/alcohol dehydrogenase